MSSNSSNIFLKRDGQAQPQRMPLWLDPAKVPLDNRTAKELFEYVYNISKEIKFFDHLNPDSDLATGDGNWQELFNYRADNVDAVWGKLQALKNTKSLPP